MIKKRLRCGQGEEKSETVDNPACSIYNIASKNTDGDSSAGNCHREAGMVEARRTGPDANITPEFRAEIP